MKKSKTNKMIERFFPTQEERIRASEALEHETATFLARYPASLVSQVKKLKAAGLSLKDISRKLGDDPRVPEIALHLSVQKQARSIGEGQ